MGEPKENTGKESSNSQAPGLALRANSCWATEQSAAGLHCALGLEGKVEGFMGCLQGIGADWGNRGASETDSLGHRGSISFQGLCGPSVVMETGLFKRCSLTSQLWLQAPGRARL